MENYKHVLIAIDLYASDFDSTLQQGLEIAKENDSKVTVLHAVEHINAYGVAQAYPTVIDIEEQMLSDAKAQLEKFRQKYDLGQAEMIVETGSPKMIILEKAKESGVDLIVLGSHGRHGLQILLGSTANAVLHHASCDVLAVRIK